jgi:hypothetical protein
MQRSKMPACFGKQALHFFSFGAHFLPFGQSFLPFGKPPLPPSQLKTIFEVEQKA